jgi:hypothetical protein
MIPNNPGIDRSRPPMVAATAPITPDTMLPELFHRHPQTRAVFDRYGLRGCGGATGPHESIRFFAAAHGVPETSLMAELVSALSQSPAGAKAAHAGHDAIRDIDAIYRRYFAGGIAVILTAGAAWGAWLLWKIGFAGSFTGVSIHEVNAHGHAQIYGWVGLFIMGFGYQAFPRMWHRDLAAPRLAFLAFFLMVAGIAVRTAGMTLAGTWTPALPAAMLGAAMELAAIIMFAGQITATFLQSGKPLRPYVGFVISALAFFILQAALSTWHTWNTMTASSREELLWYVATWQAPLRDVQIHGLALFMILGVCIRMLPGIYGVAEIRDRRVWTALVLLLLGVVGEVGVFLAYRHTGSHAMAAFLMLPWLLLAAGIAMVALPWRLWRPLPQPDRSAKFIRAAYAWLAISMLMLLLLPVYQAVSGIAFSHAYYGAIRHAITVGFISLMIMGFAARVVPTLNGIDTRRLTRLWGPFILINTGCLLRVSLQTLTDWHGGFFALVGVSGVLEVTALAWWGVGLLRVRRQGKRAAALERPAAAGGVQLRPVRITADHRVGDVLTWYPHLEAVLVAQGFTALKNPLLRRTVASRVSLREAAGFVGADLLSLLELLNARKA